MSCGCASRRGSSSPQARRARAAMCQLCERAERHASRPWIKGAVACTISGLPVGDHIAGGAPCPLGRHPDARGILGWPWRWLRWFGVPAPHRIVLATMLTGPLAGCGCIVRLKLFTLRETQAWTALFVAMAGTGGVG